MSSIEERNEKERKEENEKHFKKELKRKNKQQAEKNKREKDSIEKEKEIEKQEIEKLINRKRLMNIEQTNEGEMKTQFSASLNSFTNYNANKQKLIDQYKRKEDNTTKEIQVQKNEQFEEAKIAAKHEKKKKMREELRQRNCNNSAQQSYFAGKQYSSLLDEALAILNEVIQVCNAKDEEDQKEKEMNKKKKYDLMMDIIQDNEERKKQRKMKLEERIKIKEKENQKKRELLTQKDYDLKKMTILYARTQQNGYGFMQTNENMIYKVDKSKTDIELIEEDMNVIKERTIYRFELDSDEVIKFLEDHINSYAVSGPLLSILPYKLVKDPKACFKLLQCIIPVAGQVKRGNGGNIYTQPIIDIYQRAGKRKKENEKEKNSNLKQLKNERNEGNEEIIKNSEQKRQMNNKGDISTYSIAYTKVLFSDIISFLWTMQHSWNTKRYLTEIFIKNFESGFKHLFESNPIVSMRYLKPIMAYWQQGQQADQFESLFKESGYFGLEDQIVPLIKKMRN
ncbi:MAG: hypothetical protein EZS28_008402 [Streblomastix strix]|uniref:Uncharacterized protein n=1 Tax=Streblomastix strix TaxID=222440 RepID=A0A5J4WMG1_9EUKA|nr:MAG: hypothetical protein EZS28_008402 [Streblomastix strix]